MIQLVLHKIFSNSWKVLCLLLGSILVVGMICSIPIYANGILQRLLTKDLENAQIASGHYPGTIAIASTFNSDGQGAAETARQMQEEMAGLIRQMPVPATLQEEINSVSHLYHTEIDNGKYRYVSFDLDSITNLPGHVRIVKGRLYQDQMIDGVLEVIASAVALKNANMVMDRIYEVCSYKQKSDPPTPLKIMIVGLYDAVDNQDVYWYQNLNNFTHTLLTDPELLAGLSARNNFMTVDSQLLYAAFDFYRFRIQDAGRIERLCLQAKEEIDQVFRTSFFSTTFLPVIEEYNEREAELKLTLQILIVPILLMLVFYIFMVSQLMIRSETSIISVLESRGAGRSRILLLYGLESLVLGTATLIAGPFLGFWMVRIIGASNGFMEFIGRKALKIELDRQAILYGLAAVLLFLLTTLLPVFLQSRTSIVQQKRKKSRLARAPFWQRIFLDFLLLGISLYALYRLNAQVELQQQTGAAGIEMNLDFLLFLASTLFILGVGLLFLRLYPWILRLVYLLGRRLWSPVLFASFHQISRSDGQEQFLMIFLILSLSIGLFNANAARTINRNTEDSIRCQVGGDIRLQEYWQPYDKNGVAIDEISGNQSRKSEQDYKYNEINFERYGRLAGVEHAARVYRSDTVRIRISGNTSERINLMAVDPYDFALTAWSRSDLNRHHINEYMNVLSTRPDAVILSANLRDKFKLKVGDGIIYTVNTVDSVDGVIVAFVDYWPGFQPQVLDVSNKPKENNLIVANLEFVLSRTTIRPYEVWLKRSAATTDKVIYDAIKAAKINITTIESASQLINEAKNDPQLQGTNGALTLGFIVSMLICAIGFLIYWIMALQSRILQFGVFRAMGLGRGSVIGMLLCEQGMVSGVAILFGIFLGSLSSKLFVPLFQLVYSSVDQPLPFRVIALASDSRKIYLILGCLLLVCFAVLIRMLLRIRIDQAVKLGEE